MDDEARAGEPGRPPEGLILIVEDFRPAREGFATWLQLEGYRTVGASNGEQAIRIAREQRPDLILMDAGLPGVSGWDVTAVLKGNPQTRSIPVLMVTGDLSREARQRAVDVGADGFVGKPLRLDELEEAISSALRKDSC